MGGITDVALVSEWYRRFAKDLWLIASPLMPRGKHL